MVEIQSFGRTLVIAPHPDDEVLGAGGLIARLADAGSEVTVAVVTSGRPPAYSRESVSQVQSEARSAHRHLGVSRTLFLDLPATQLSETPVTVLNSAIENVVHEYRPETILLPFVGDIHVDHQKIFLSGMVASRPHTAVYPRTILAYETLSETNWNAPYVSPSFIPNCFIDIGTHIDRKIEAMKMFQSQVRDAPHERSVEVIKALATLRGGTVHRKAAEAFIIVRHVI